MARKLQPDVVLLDIRMPGMDGLTAAAHLAELPNAPKVVLLTTFDLDEYVHRGLRAKAVGFLLKDTPPRDLITAVRTVYEGNAMLAPVSPSACWSGSRLLAGTVPRRRPGGWKC